MIATSGEGYKATADGLNEIGLIRKVDDSTVVCEQKPNGSWFKH